MIGSLRGKVAHKDTSSIIIDVGGVGYLVRVPFSVLSELPPTGGEATLLIHTHVRDDAIVLYGFGNEGEKRVFNALLGITGIGPKLALAVLSGLPYEEFLRAVEGEQVSQLTKIPGLGKKTANRIVLELKGKLPRDEAAPDKVPSFEDAVSALVNLGYRKADAVEAVDMAVARAGSDDLEAVLRESLKLLTQE